jgi:curli biogenesis system outer membrane secretion channel CsgG
VLAATLLCGCARYVWVEKEVPPSFDNTFVRKIAVVEFKNRTGYSLAGRAVADRIEELLVNEGCYEVMTRMDLERVVSEHKLSLEGLLDSDTTKRVGLIAGVDALVIGTVDTYEIEETQIKPLKVARRASVALCIKAVNTTTGQVVCSKSADGTFFWRGWTDTDAAMSPRQCLQEALNDAMRDARALFPHTVKVKELVE